MVIAAPFVPPWRRNVRKPETGENPITATIITPVVAPGPVFTNSQPSPVAATQLQDSQPKTSKLQINLRSVKKPEPTPQLPPQQQQQQQQFGPTYLKPAAKVIPIFIQQENNSPPPPLRATLKTTSIPIQRSAGQPEVFGANSDQKPVSVPATTTTNTATTMPKAPSGGGPPPPAPPPPPNAPPPPPPPAG